MNATGASFLYVNGLNLFMKRFEEPRYLIDSKELKELDEIRNVLTDPLPNDGDDMAWMDLYWKFQEHLATSESS